MNEKATATVRAFPTRLVALAACAMIAALAMIGWTAYEGFRQSRQTGQLVSAAQTLQSQIITMQQGLSAMLTMASATGDIRWSYRYTVVIDDLTALAAEADAISGNFAGAADRVVKAGISVAQYQAGIVELLRENQVEAAREAVLGPAFRIEREAYQEALTELGNEVENLTRTAQEIFERRFFWSAVGTIVVLGFALAVGIVAVRRLGEWRDTLAATVSELRQYEAELENRVAERTSALKSTEVRLRAAVDNLSGGIFMVDRNLDLQMFNDRFVELYDLPGDVVRVGGNLADILRIRAERGEYGPGDTEELVRQRVTSYRDSPDAHLEDYIASSDRTIELYRSKMDDGGIVAVFNDISERKRARGQLEDAHEIMHDSIQYASRIQRSLLPKDDVLHEMFEDHFCIWQPRDVVGGDMYWVKPDRRGYIVALFDCTGHGVPGALMTTIVELALNVAFAETGDPSRLISRVNQIIKEALGQQDKNSLSDDGVEMGVCLVEPERMRLTYAGARFELLSAIGDTIDVIKGDRSGIGYTRVPLDQRYTNHSVRLSPGQRLYMYTDGVTDQVGGEARRGFGRRRLLRLLGDVAHLPLHEQGAAITQSLAAYQGSEARRDDVSMIGFMAVR